MTGASRALRLGLALLIPTSASAQQATTPASPPPEAPAACQGEPDLASCRSGCVPGKLIFLPCMAVGAANMAQCREREVAACLRACVQRHCS